MEATATGEYTNHAQSHVEAEPKRGQENAIIHVLHMEERTVKGRHRKVSHVIQICVQLMEATVIGEHTNHAQSHVEAEPKRGQENAIIHVLHMEERTVKERHRKVSHVTQICVQLMEATVIGEHTNHAQNHVEAEPKRGQENAIIHVLSMEERTVKEHHRKVFHVIQICVQLMEATVIGEHTDHAQSHVEAEPKRGQENAIIHVLHMEERTVKERHRKVSHVIQICVQLMEATVIGEHTNHAQNHVEAEPKRGQENAIIHVLHTEERTVKERHRKVFHVMQILVQLMEATVTGEHTNHAQNHVEAELKRGQESAIIQDLLMEEGTA